MQLDAQDPLHLLAEERRVRALARRLAVDADDLVQESFLRFLQGGALALRDPSAWLARVARNVAHNLRCEERHRAAREHRAAVAERVPSSAELVEREERRAALVAAVDALPAPLRAVVWLRFFEDLPPRRIAQELGIPVMTVSNRLRRALQILRARLDAEHGDVRAWLAPLCMAWPRGAVPLAATGVIAMTKTKIFAAVAALLVLAVSYSWWPAPVPTPAASAPPDAAIMTAGAELPAEEHVAPDLAPRETVIDATNAVATTGEALVRVHYAADDAPAAGVMVIIVPRRGDPRIDCWRVRADAEGKARFAALPAGKHAVCTDRTLLPESIEVRAGETSSLDLAIAVGLDLSGVVVDASGAPVAGALIEVGAMGRADHDAEVVATTGADGRFAVRSVAPMCLVGARAAGHAASPLRFLTGKAGNRADVRIELGAAGGEVEGTVVGPEGEPVADAVVMVGSGNTRGLAGSERMPPLPALVRTDAAGRFRAVGIASGEQPVCVRAADLAPWRGTCVVARGSPAVLAVALAPGARVHGVVRDGAGAPVPGAEVEVGNHADFAYCRAFTSKDGAFELAGLSAGEVELVAQHDEVGTVSKTLHTEAGAVAECVLELSRGLELRGRVRDEQGDPVSRVVVECFAEQATSATRRWSAYTFADSDGRFAVANCPESGTLEVALSGEGIADLRRTGVDPSKGELEVRVRRTLPATVRITGRVVGPEGEPIANAYASAGHAGVELASTGPNGDFALGPLPPGPRTVSVRASGYPMFASERRELAAEESWDLGTIRLVCGGNAVIAQAEGDTDGVYWSVTDRSATRRLWVAAASTESVRTESLPPGECMLFVSGKGVAAQALPFAVRAGEDTELDVRTQPGIRQRVELDLPGEIDPMAGVDLRVQCGVDLVQWTRVTARTGEPVATELWLAPGHYLLAARAGTWQGRADCTVGAEESRPVRLTLQ